MLDKFTTKIKHNRHVYEYKDTHGYYHLISHGKDLLEGKKAINVTFYKNGVYQYTDENYTVHLIEHGTDRLEGMNAIFVRWLIDGIFIFKTSDGDIVDVGLHDRGINLAKERVEAQKHAHISMIM